MQNRRVYMKKRKKRKKIWTFVLLPLLLLLIGGGAYATFLFNKAQSVIQQSFEQIDGREKSEKRMKEVDPNSDNISVLFIGVDDSSIRQEKGMGAVRSDALVLATFNVKDKTVKLLSIPRDSYVYIPIEKNTIKLHTPTLTVA